MGNSWLIVLLLASMIYLFVTIVKFDMNPFFSMITASLFMGIIVGIDFPIIVTTITSGFGGVLSGLGIVIALGALLGKLLGEAGATDSLASWMLDKVGESKAGLAINITGFLVSIPVFFGAAYIVLNPLLKFLSRRTKKPIQTYITSLSVGLLVTHCMIIPTPGPLTVAGTLGANMGAFIFYSIIISVPASLIAGWLYGEFLAKKIPYKELEEIENIESDQDDNVEQAPAGLAIGLIGLPLMLILLGTVIPSLTTNELILSIGGFLTQGTGVMSLLITVTIASYKLRPYIKTKLSKLVTNSFNEIGEIFMLLGAGGAFGQMVQLTGIGDYFVELLTTWNISILILGFALSILLRTALGSAAIAVVTTSSIVAPVAAQVGASPVILGLTICAASLAIATPTDAAFWIVQSLDDLSLKDTFLTYSLGNVLACGILMILILLLNSMSGILPGLS